LDALLGEVAIEPGAAEFGNGVWSGGPLEGAAVSARVLLGEGGELGERCRIEGPAVVGDGCRIGAGAVVRDAILLESAKVPADGMLAGGMADVRTRSLT